MNHGHRGVKWEASEVDLGGEQCVVALVEIRQDARSWIYNCEVMKCTEEATGGYLGEWLQPLHNHYLSIVDADATDENVETIYNNIGVKVAELQHRCEGF